MQDSAIIEDIKRLSAMMPRPDPNAFNGKIVSNHHCLEKTDVRLFPKSVHRSARIHKKLVKRHGGEFKMRPTIFVMNGVAHAHPALYAKLERKLSEVSAPMRCPSFLNPHKF